MTTDLAIYDMDRTITRHATYTPFLLHCAARRAPWRLLLLPFVILSMLAYFFKGVLDTFFPGTVRIDDRGVAYRGRRMTFNRVEEVTTTSPIEIVGDQRILRLAETFCPRAAVEPVVHELQRLIVEVGSAHQM